jgi:hypothetical protein
MIRTMLTYVFFSIIISFVGCGGTKGAYSVSGKVTTVDGTPVTDGVVSFTSETLSASGALRADGTFSLGTQKEGDGALPGTYRVSFSGNCLGGGYDNKPPQIHTKYGKPDTSGLTYEVKAGTNQPADFKLEKP